MKDNNKELLPIVDEDGNVIGKATRGDCHDGSKKLHPVIHLHVFDSTGRIYLQKRPMWKTIEPGKYDMAVGGHIDFGENVEDALRREAMEELNLSVVLYETLKSFIYESDREREYVYNFKIVVEPSEINPSDELDGGQWWTVEEIINSDKKCFTPNLLYDIDMLNLLQY